MAGGKRPFWMHQLVEYILGGALVASGLQSPTPALPAVCGGLIMLNAALTRGALGAFRAYGRAVHRVLDVAVIAACVAAALQPWISVDNGTRVIVLGIVAVHLVVFFGSSYAERKAVAAGGQGDRSTEIGKAAGRAVGTGVNVVRRMRR